MWGDSLRRGTVEDYYGPYSSFEEDATVLTPSINKLKISSPSGLLSAAAGMKSTDRTDTALKSQWFGLLVYGLGETWFSLEDWYVKIENKDFWMPRERRKVYAGENQDSFFTDSGGISGLPGIADEGVGTAGIGRAAVSSGFDGGFKWRMLLEPLMVKVGRFLLRFCD